MGSQHREWFSKAWTHSQRLRFNWGMGTIGRSLCLGCTMEKNDGGLSGKNPSILDQPRASSLDVSLESAFAGLPPTTSPL